MECGNKSWRIWELEDHHEAETLKQCGLLVKQKAKVEEVIRLRRQWLQLSMCYGMRGIQSYSTKGDLMKLAYYTE